MSILVPGTKIDPIHGKMVKMKKEKEKEKRKKRKCLQREKENCETKEDQNQNYCRTPLIETLDIYKREDILLAAKHGYGGNLRNSNNEWEISSV